MLTASFLNSLAPRPSGGEKRAIYDAYVVALTSEAGKALLRRYGVVTNERLAHFMAQIAHESGGFTLIWESGSYSAKRIMQIFGVGKHSAKVTQTEANRLAGNGPALFERVYGLGNPKKAKELGNTQSGDGWRFRGLGPQQITGRWAHERYAQKIGCALDELALPINGLHAALLEWNDKTCNPLADSDDGTERALRAITKRINGGFNGLPDRREKLKKAQRLLAGGGAVFDTISTEKPILEIGDDGKDVRRLQELLVGAGYIIPVDGRMGPKTEAALSGFQANYGLVQTGRADDATWEMLKAANAEGAKTPRTRDVPEEKIAKESVAGRVLARIRFWAGWGWRLIFGGSVATATAESGGLEVLEGVSSGWDRVSSMWDKLDLPAAFSSTRGIVFLCIIAVGLGLWLFDRWSKKAQQDQKDDADLSANLAI